MVNNVNDIRGAPSSSITEAMAASGDIKKIAQPSLSKGDNQLCQKKHPLKCAFRNNLIFDNSILIIKSTSIIFFNN